MGRLRPRLPHLQWHRGRRFEGNCAAALLTRRPLQHYRGLRRRRFCNQPVAFGESGREPRLITRRVMDVRVLLPHHRHREGAYRQYESRCACCCRAPEAPTRPGARARQNEIVSRARLRIAQNSVGAVDFFDAPLGLLVASVDIRMKLLRQSPIGSPDVLATGVAG